MNRFRPPSEIEKRLFALLLSRQFLGREEVASQLDACVVKDLDENGSVEIRVAPAPLATTERRIPTEAQARDDDGIVVHALLHVVDGKVVELELYKDDSSRIVSQKLDWNLAPI